MNSYRVYWSIDIEAETPAHAVAKAFEIQRDPDSIATAFEVYGPDCPLEGLQLDLESFRNEASGTYIVPTGKVHDLGAIKMPEVIPISIK